MLDTHNVYLVYISNNPEINPIMALPLYIGDTKCFQSLIIVESGATPTEICI